MYSVLNKLSKYIYFYISKNFLKLLNAFNVSLNHEQGKMARMLSVYSKLLLHFCNCSFENIDLQDRQQYDLSKKG